MKWTVPEGFTGTAYLCQCKYSKNSPLCDGSRTSLVAVWRGVGVGAHEDCF